MRQIDLTGQKFGSLTVIRRVPKNKQYGRVGVRWVVKCDCGIEKITIGSYLRTGHTKSCGCRKNLSIALSKKLPKGESGFRKVLTSYKWNAKTKGIDWAISDDKFKSITQMECFYCGREASNSAAASAKQSYASVESSEWAKFHYNGVDRLDNTKGYSDENCVSACKDCNYAKKNKTFYEFKLWVESIYRKLNGRNNPI